MAKDNTYSEKLKSPKWQKKRLKIMERDGFQCQMCFNRDDTLTVHHKYYLSGKEPWEYEGECLITLCEDCHSEIHLHENIKSIQYKRSNDYGINLTDLCILEFRILQINKEHGNIKQAIRLLTSQIIKKHQI